MQDVIIVGGRCAGSAIREWFARMGACAARARQFVYGASHAGPHQFADVA